MKTRTFIMPAVLSLALLGGMYSCQQPATDTATEEPEPSATVEELGQMNRNFAKALVAGDARAAALQYDENASLLPPNEPIVTSRANIQAYWQGAIDAGIIGASVKTLDAGSNGDLGYEIGTFELQFKGENGDTIIDTGKYTEILQRDTTGNWISLYGMWSGNGPAETEEPKE